MPIKENHNSLVRCNLGDLQADLSAIKRRSISYRKLTDIADAVTEWQGTYSYQIHSMGSIIDFWFEYDNDALMFRLSL